MQTISIFRKLGDVPQWITKLVGVINHNALELEALNDQVKQLSREISAIKRNITGQEPQDTGEDIALQLMRLTSNTRKNALPCK
jgi:hypothetical protein